MSVAAVPAAPDVMARLDPGAFDADAALASFRRAHAGSGAIAAFIGQTRRVAADGGAVEALFLDHHPTLSVASLTAIAQAGATRFALDAALVVHRCGAVGIAQPIVLVATAAPHRRAAFDACDYLMDRLKTEALLWKREARGDGAAVWIEPTDADRVMRQRWDVTA
jgi:molybdopterin synthase catalytic subunit